MAISALPESAVIHGWKPTLLCNVTTAIGLLSLCTSELAPIRKFGEFSALAVMATVLLMFTLLPATLQIWPLKARTRAQRQRQAEPWYEKYMSRFWETLGGGIIRHHALVSAGCILLIASLGYGVTRINTSVNLLKMFDPKAKILQDYAWLETHLGKLVPMEIVLKVPPQQMRKLAAERASDESLDPDEAYRLSFLERMELADRVQRVIEQEFGAPGQNLAGRSMSAATFAPPLPQAKGDNLTFARRVGTNGRLEAHRNEFLHSDYLRCDKVDGSELWRVSMRLGALQDVDYGAFVNELKCAVEPVLAAQREREKILRAILQPQAGKSRVAAKVLLVGAPLGPSKKSGPAFASPRSEAMAKVSPPARPADVRQPLDQTKIFSQSLVELLHAARLKLDTFDPRLEKLPEDWPDRLAKYDCVVLVGDHASYSFEDIRSHAQLLIDVRNHRFEPAAAAQDQTALAATTAAAAAPAASVSAVYTGVVPIVYKAQRTLLNSLIQSTVWSFATIAPLMMLVSRSAAAGLVAMLPNILPVFVIFGLMGWLGIAVDIGSMMTASIALGVAVNDTIHYLAWFRDELDACKDRRKAILTTYTKCATPTLQAAMISGLGLSIFALSTFTPTQRFGYLMLSILWAGVAAELIFFPALLAGPLGAAFKPRKKKTRPRAMDSPTAGSIDQARAPSVAIECESVESGKDLFAEPIQHAIRPHIIRRDARHSA